MSNLIVTTLTDGIDETDGEMSLAEAIAAANADADASTITFDGALLTNGKAAILTAAEIGIFHDLKIDGDLDDDGVADVTIDAGGTHRAVLIQGADVEMDGLVITGSNDSGIQLAFGSLTFSNGSVTGNVTEQRGGGIRADGELTLVNSSVTENEALASGGGVYINSGAIASITGTLIDGNTAGFDGGGLLSTGFLMIEDSTISNNESGRHGGGVEVQEGFFDGRGLTISGNDAALSGGGMNVIVGGHHVTLLDSTISGNTAGGGAGGLHAVTGRFERLAILDNEALGSNDGGALITGFAWISNATIAGNTAQNTGGIAIYDGGAGDHLTVTGNSIAGTEASGVFVGVDTRLYDSIVAGNSGGTDVYGSSFAPGEVRSNVFGTAHDGSYATANLIGVMPDVLFAQVVGGSGVVADNGGRALTVALLDDALNPAIDEALGGAPTDARGYMTVDNRDLGAFELNGLPPAPPTPMVGTEISTVEVIEDTNVLWVVPNDAFTGGEGVLTLAADGGEGTALPDWLTFDAATRTLSGTPEQDFDGEVTLRLVAKDENGQTAEQTFTLDLTPVNDAPVAPDLTPVTTDAAPVTIDFAEFATDVDGSYFEIVKIDGQQITPVFDLLDPSFMPIPLFPDVIDHHMISPRDLDGGFIGDIGYMPVALASGATLTHEGGTVWSYLPAPDAAGRPGEGNGPGLGQGGTDAFTYTLADGDGGYGHGSVTVTILGDASNDNMVRGGKALDVLFGRAGADRLMGRGGDDTLTGNGGDDVLHGGSGSDELFGHTGSDTLYGGSGDDLLMGGSGDDHLGGGSGADLLRGAEGVDTLRGRNGADLLRGGIGDDDLHGGRGRDELIGGEGADALAGGGGRDAFVFAGAFGTDTVSDWGRGRDRIDLSAANTDLGALAIVQHGDDAVIEVAVGATLGKIVLEDTDAQDLSAGDFLF